MTDEKLKQIYEFLKSEVEKNKGSFLNDDALTEAVNKMQDIKNKILENNKKLNRFGYGAEK
ncbi:hypothetical protein [Pseudoalteromonas sp. BSi20495]|uniref:hypothetical protein n=1 Tax=Pseudoalteromonas sp. BSi20495 TaxID=386429 RepID=UPI00023159C7|nr:hypothetical protein [Pseudoalteromonas sp. BSi20495]GAA78198.1 hypothetical protein P20495_0689 [Pseudoalteromonas sp. BSi20495]